MVEIKEYQEEYAKEMSNIIITNMYEINIKDHGKEIIDKLSKQIITVNADQTNSMCSVYTFNL